MDTQTIQIITDIALFIAIVVVGLILHNQIKAQASVIKSFEAYFKIFDIDKVKQFDKLRHDTTMMYVKTYLNTELKKKIKPELQAAERYDEICNVLLDVILTLEPADREQFIKENLVVNETEVLNALREIENENNTSSSGTTLG